MKLRCLVIDDEPLALNVLADYVRQTKGLQLIDITTKPVQGLQRVLANEADLVFLDIQMPGLSGIDFLKQTYNHCKVILTTAYAEYALEGYEYNVTDYLLKPVAYERFLKAVQKVPLPAIKEQNITPPVFFFVKSEYKLVRVDYAEVLYMEALRDYVAIHITNGQKILTLQSMASFEKELPPHLFIRIHKSYIIAISSISSIEKNKVVIQGNYLPVGETYRNNIKKYIR